MLNRDPAPLTGRSTSTWPALHLQKLRKEYRDVVDTLHRTQQNITSSLKSYKNAVDGLEQQIAKDKRMAFLDVYLW